MASDLKKLASTVVACALGGGLGLALTPHPQEDLPVARGFFQIAAGLRMQRGQTAVGRHQTGEHAQRRFDGQRSALAMAKPRERNAQIEVTQRKKVLQSHGQQSLLR